ncbi:MAG: hypothetical protein WC969_04605 [Elusimicrobiota bacterium]|jgi:hypothetical protein
MQSGWQNLSGMAAVGARSSGSPLLPSWLFGIVAAVVVLAALTIVLGVVGRFLKSWQESRQAARIAANYLRVTEEGRKARETRGEPPIS